jgi:hypothetical protein
MALSFAPVFINQALPPMFCSVAPCGDARFEESLGTGGSISDRVGHCAADLENCINAADRGCHGMSHLLAWFRISLFAAHIPRRKY